MILTNDKVMTKDEAMEKLERVCGERGISVVHSQNAHRRTWFYWPDMKMIVLFSNANNKRILALHSHIKN